MGSDKPAFDGPDTPETRQAIIKEMNDMLSELDEYKTEETIKIAAESTNSHGARTFKQILNNERRTETP